MSDIAIQVEGLSKQYHIGGKQERYRTLRDTLTDAVTVPFRRLASVVRGQSSRVADETIWALKDVSFEVKRGEVVGVIGRNGAGKSTLLKILSQITEPTEGRAEIYGRVGSLLEVGTGFHPELTGRENIYLNGAILGMTRAEIDRKFDEIVDFSGVEKFIDTPVKHYSSGMHVRLAFAVAAHLDPEILLVDEVLAVGDAAFQKKCLGKMGEVASEGRTVLFVSHNMESINSLCNMGMLLNAGHLILDDNVTHVISYYLETLSGKTAKALWENPIEGADINPITIKRVKVCDRAGMPKDVFQDSEGIYIRVHYVISDNLPGLHIKIRIVTFVGGIVLTTTDAVTTSMQRRNKGEYISTCRIPSGLLNEGEYSVMIWAHLSKGAQLVEKRKLVSFSVYRIQAKLATNEALKGVINPGNVSWDVCST